MALNREAINVVVMASGVNRIPLYEGYAPGYKALLPFHGRASIHYVLDALHGVNAVQRVCIEGPRSLLEAELAGRKPEAAYEFEEGGETLLESIMIGLKHFSTDSAALFVTADLPLVTGQAVQDFLQVCADAPVEYAHNVYISGVARESYIGPYTWFTKSYNPYRDIRVCHGNLFIADPGLLENRKALERINRMYEGRKSPLTSAMALGWKIALTYILGVEWLHLLTLKQMAALASRDFGFGIVPVVIDHPGITIDVDEPEDYQFVRKMLEKPGELAAA